MQYDQLALIRRYCDTTGIRLHQDEKDLLCRVLEDPGRYDGFTSHLYEEKNSGKDHSGRWETIALWQYRISFDYGLAIYKRFRFSCDDGYVDERAWEWPNAVRITQTRQIISILREMEPEL